MNFFKNFGKHKELPEGLTEKELQKEVLSIALPSLSELFLVQLASIADVAMVTVLGSWAITSVTITNQPKFMLQAIFIALNTGATALIARFKGEDNRKNANETMRQIISISLFLSILISIIGYVFAEPIMGIMKPDSQQIFDNAVIYFKIQMIGFTFSAVTMAITAALRGIGYTKGPFFYNIIANVVNVILNYLMIGGNFGFPKWGVAGASLATIIGQFVAFAMALVLIYKPTNYLYFRPKHMFTFDMDLIKRMVKISLPAVIEQIIMRGGMFIYVTIVLALGDEIYAAHSIAVQILSFSYLNGQAFGIAATALLGRSLGEKRVDYAKAYTNEARKQSVILAFIIGIGFILFSTPFMRMFTSNDSKETAELIVREGSRALIIVALLQPMQASQLVLNGALRGAGDTLVVSIVTFVGILFLRPLGGYILINYAGLGLSGAWIAMSIDQVFRYFASKIRFASDKWSEIKI